MGTLYESIKSLCDEKGVTGGKMCVDLGISKSTMTDLKSGRRTGISLETAQKIADYFGVTVDRVLGSDQKEKNPAPESVEFSPEYIRKLLNSMTTAEIADLMSDAAEELKRRG